MKMINDTYYYTLIGKGVSPIPFIDKLINYIFKKIK